MENVYQGGLNVQIYRWGVLLAIVIGVAVCVTATELEPTNIEIILDASNSMSETVPGGVKIDVARRAIEQLLEILPASYNVGLRGYGHRFSHTDTGRSCTDTELLSALKPLTQENRTAIKQRLTLMQPKGMTPIAYTLEQAVNDFFGLTGKNIIILISDGEETCGGDPLAIADYITSLGIGIKVYVIGFDVGSREQLEGIALRTGGHYYDARNAIELGNALKQAVWEATSVLFFDDFEGEMSPVWRTNPVRGSSLGVEKDALTIVGEALEDQPLKAFVGSSLWSNYILSVDLVHSRYWAEPWQRDHQVVLFLRVQDSNNMIGFFFQSGGQSGFRVKRHGIWCELVAAGEVPKVGSYHVVIAVEGPNYSATVNDELIATLADSTFSRGYVGLQCAYDNENKYYFDNFTVAPLE